MPAQGSSHQAKPRGKRGEQESGRRLSMEDLSASPTPAQPEDDDDSEEELLQGEQLLQSVQNVADFGLSLSCVACHCC